MEFNRQMLSDLLQQASCHPRLRQALDLRTTPADTSQRILNALQPGTAVPVHRHPDTSETVFCLQGRLDEVFFEETVTENGDTQWKESRRVPLCPEQGQWGLQVPAGVWHTIEVIEPSVILEVKDGPYKPASPDDIRA